ncbi:MAG: thermonuclease family protein [Nitrospiraceae bacterium]|nr:thermonuclease family protein [Nitrospiraceae bacterium]
MQVNRKYLKLITLFAALILLLGYSSYDRKDAESRSYDTAYKKVLRVSDGDTIKIIFNKKRTSVRLIGIDAPELKQKPWGQRSKKHLQELLKASDWQVRLEFDVDKRDRYDRLLCYVYTKDGDMINAKMLSDGYAVLYTITPNVKYVEQLRDAQLKAREQKLGIWGSDGLTEKPSDYRKKHKN